MATSTGTGAADIIVAPGPGDGPQVKVFDGRDLRLLLSFFAYSPAFQGGVFIATVDVDGDARTDVITGAGPGGAAHVMVFDGATGAEVRSFLAFPGLAGGVRVGATDRDGDGRADILVGAGPGGAPVAAVFSGLMQAEVESFFAFEEEYSGGVFVG